MKLRVLAVDVKTTGQRLTKDSLIAIGCSVMDENASELDQFEAYMSVPNEYDVPALILMISGALYMACIGASLVVNDIDRNGNASTWLGYIISSIGWISGITVVLCVIAMQYISKFARGWEGRCILEFWSKNTKTLDMIKSKMKDPASEMKRFERWLNRIDLEYGDTLIVVSDNAGFDFAWIDTYLSEYTKRYSIYYRYTGVTSFEYRRTWCTNSAFHGALIERDPNKYIEWNLEEKLGVENGVYKNDHNPLNDARKIAADYILFRTKLNFQ